MLRRVACTAARTAWAPRPVPACSRAFATAPAEDALQIIYEGPLNGAVKRIKVVSATTLGCSLLLPALVVAFKSSETVSSLGKLAVGGTACFAGIGSTAALHWCTLPFVFEIRRDGKHVVATRMNLLARRTTHTFTMDDVVLQPQTWRPFVSFEANGVPFFCTQSGFADPADAAHFGAQ